MSFSRSAAAVHTVEQIIGEIESAYEKARLALADLPEQLRAEAIQEIKQKAAQWNPGGRTHNIRIGDLVGVSGDGNTVLVHPSATQAILNLLSSTGRPLTTEEIQNALRGKFQTSADKPERVISSTLSQLRGNGRILLDNGHFSILKPAGGSAGEDTSLKDRVVAYFHKTGNKPATTTELATKVNGHPNALRSLFSTNKGTLFETTGTETGGFKLWRLISGQEERP